MQLRLEGIDTPETHFKGRAQPLGDSARDALLAWAGFGSVRYSDAGTVTEAEPARRSAVVLTKAFDPNQRAISYLLMDEANPPADGHWVDVSDELVGRTLNARALSEGTAYLTLYTSTPASHGRVLRELAREAREQNRGVWEADETAQFPLRGRESIEPPDGELVLPKLFRRCSDYLAYGEKTGYAGTLGEWLVDVSLTGRRPENDLLLVCGGTEVSFSAVVQHVRDRIRFTADPLDIVFVEK